MVTEDRAQITTYPVKYYFSRYILNCKGFFYIWMEKQYKVNCINVDVTIKNIYFYVNHLFNDGNFRFHKP